MVDETLRMRWATVADIDRIVDYHRACWDHSFAAIVSAEVMEFIHARPLDEPRAAWHDRLGPASEAKVIVATDSDDRPFGHIWVEGNELVHLFIAPDHHGKGIGRQLLVVAERLIRQAGHRQAELHTIVGNAPAIGLYEAARWVLTEETLVEELPNGSSYVEHVMRKDLADSTDVQANRSDWDADAPNWVERGRRSWSSAPHWGEMSIAETEVGVLRDLAGCDVVELGCGTGYLSSWCLAAGAASAIGVDNSSAQLRSAQTLQTEFGQTFPLVWADAEHAPFADGSFDVAINEYGAGLWCDPYRWIPEAARILRPAGRLIFLTRSTLLGMAVPDFEHERTSTELLRPQRAMHRMTFPDTDAVEFTLGHGDWIEVLTSNRFRVDRLIELYAPESGGPERYSYYDAGWARRWPPEEIWCATYLE